MTSCSLTSLGYTLTWCVRTLGQHPDLTMRSDSEVVVSAILEYKYVVFEITIFLVSILQTAHLWANTGVVLESCRSLG